MEPSYLEARPPISPFGNSQIRLAPSPLAASVLEAMHLSNAQTVLTGETEPSVPSFTVQQVAPFSPPCFSSEERASKLRTLFEKENGNGILLVNLFGKKIFNLFQELLLHPKFRKTSKNSVGLSDGSILTIEKCAWRYLSIIQETIGLLWRWREEKGCRWTDSIGAKDNTGTIHDKDSDYQIVIQRNFEGSEFLEDLLRDFLPEAAKPLLNAVGLFREMIFQEMHALNQPFTLSEIVFSVDHLHGHLKHLKFILQKFDRFIPNEIEFSEETRMLFENDKENLLKACELIEKSLKKISFPPSFDQLSELYSLFLHLHIDSESALACSALSQEMELQITQLNESHSVDHKKLAKIATFLNLSRSYIASFQSCVNSSFLSISSQLFRLSRLSSQRIKEQLIKTVDLLESLRLSEFTADESILNSIVEKEEEMTSLAAEELAADPRIHALALATQHVRLKIFNKAFLQLFKQHLDLLNSPQASEIDHVLALKDILVMFRTRFADGYKKLHAGFQTAPRLNQDHPCYTLMEALGGMFEVTDRAASLIDQEVVEMLLNGLEQAGQRSKAETAATEEKAEESAKELILLSAAAKKRAQKKRAKARTLSSDIPSKEEEIEEVRAPSLAMPIAKSESPAPIEGKLEPLFREIEVLMKSAPVKGADEKERYRFRQETLQNLEGYLLELSETLSKPTFSIDTLFGELDSIRRIIEGTLMVGLAHYPVLRPEGDSVLHNVKKWAHRLTIFLDHYNQDAIPEHLKRILSSLKTIPRTFAEGNSAINYLHSTAEETHLDPYTQALVHYLKELYEESRQKVAHPSRRDAFLQEHQKLVDNALFFASAFLNAINDPTYHLPRSLVSLPDQPLPCLKAEDETLESSEDEKETLSAVSQEPPQLRVINEAPVAVQTIHEIIAWLRIQSFVSSGRDVATRKRISQRNAYLKNVETDLLRLKEKLMGGAPDPYSRCFGESRLLRRAYKNLCFAALLNSAEGLATIERKQLWHQNSTALLHTELQPLYPKARLPNLYDPQFGWLAYVHRVFNYPASHDDLKGLQAQAVRTVAKNVRELASTKRLLPRVEADYTLIHHGEGVSHSGDAKPTRELIESREALWIFPLLAALFQTTRATS